MSERQIINLEDKIQEEKEAIKLVKVLDVFTSSKEFDAIINEELYTNFVKSKVFGLNDYNVNKEDVIKDLEMVSRFKDFLLSIRDKGNMAEKSIADTEALIYDVRTNGGNY